MPRLTAAVALIATLALGACATGVEPFSPRPHVTGGFPNIGYATWTDEEPPYRLYPGDQIEVRVPSAPELSQKVLTVQPDGRISMPLIGQVSVADRPVPDAEAVLTRAYASQLIHPRVEIAVTTAAPLKIFVGGEVDKPGVYDMPGPIDALQAVITAGGFKTTAKRGQVVVIRRGADGRAMLRTADLLNGIYQPDAVDAVPLRRFDIVYVPRSGVAEVGLFMQQYLRDALPIQFSYAINGTRK
jgi:protein involved in polysaccharide export with SLBB domain